VTYAIFDTPAIHPIPGIKELAQAGGEKAPPPVTWPPSAQCHFSRLLRALRTVDDHAGAVGPGRRGKKVPWLTADVPGTRSLR
jgi:hypothetical protein